MLPHYRLPELHPLIRDLAWCVSSPSLVQIPRQLNPALPEFNASINIVETPPDDQFALLLQRLNNDPTPLVDWLNNAKSQRLGHRFEHFWHFYWLANYASEHCLFNVQLHQNGKTRGELDAVLYQGAEQPLHHVELAYKFYLGHPESTANNSAMASSERWIGPNARDRLDLKLKQMSEKQLKMLDHATELLPGDWHYSGYRPQLLMKGWLFYPLSDDMPAPDVGSHNHNGGVWLTPTQLHQLEQQPLPNSEQQWLILERKNWLGWTLFETHGKPQENAVLNTQQLIAALGAAMQSGESSVMFAQLAASPLDNNYLEEQQRFILVPDHWPAITS